jgi:hypothetical protein
MIICCTKSHLSFFLFVVIPSFAMEDTLQENTRYVFSSSSTSQLKGPDDSSSPSLCELKCGEQQTALVECMNSLRQEAEQSHPSGAVTTKEKKGMKNSCLSSSVAAWTECCSKANLNEE